jgi:hypothetical protein
MSDCACFGGLYVSLKCVVTPLGVALRMCMQFQTVEEQLQSRARSQQSDEPLPKTSEINAVLLQLLIDIARNRVACLTMS